MVKCVTMVPVFFPPSGCPCEGGLNVLDMDKKIMLGHQYSTSTVFLHIPFFFLYKTIYKGYDIHIIFTRTVGHLKYE